MTWLAIGAATGVAILVVVWFGQRQLIYLPAHDVTDPPPDVSALTTKSTDGVRHELWLVPAEGDPIARVVVFNGNAGNKTHRLPLARSLAAEGMESLLFDYRGYGDTEGHPSEEGLLRDGAAVAEVGLDTRLPVVYLGESLGAGVATALAIEQPPSALVLRSPFTSLADMAKTHYPLLPAGLLLRDRYDVERAIPDVRVPVLVVLGSADSIVPPRLSVDVFEAASEPRQLVEVPGVDHNDPRLTSGPALAVAVRTFLEGHGAPADRH
jgi:uncharacterized protein